MFPNVESNLWIVKDFTADHSHRDAMDDSGQYDRRLATNPAIDRVFARQGYNINCTTDESDRCAPELD